jgi:hypothetical protein
MDAKNGFIVGEARKNYIGIARQIKSVFGNDTAVCSDGFRLGGISVIYRELVSVIKQALSDAASHVAQANESEFYLICSKTFHSVVSVIFQVSYISSHIITKGRSQRI